jgi:putative PIN family toxin of toxin-antitoxin system
MRRLIVVDTNVFVSRMLNPLSMPGRAVARALEEDRIAVSTATLTELRLVLRRPKFLAYIRPGSVEPILDQIFTLAVRVEIHTRIHACRDPRDDKFLEVAVYGRADAIITGDLDLLELNPFRGIAIITPADYLGLK